MKKLYVLGFLFFAANVEAFAAKCKAFLCQEMADPDCRGYCYDHCELGDGSHYFVGVLLVLLLLSLSLFGYWRRRALVRLA